MARGPHRFRRAVGALFVSTLAQDARMATDAQQTTSTPAQDAPGNTEPATTAQAATGGTPAQSPADPFAGLNLSAEDRQTVLGIMQGGARDVWELLKAKREANAEAKALRLAREKAEALGYKAPEGHIGEFDPLTAALDALAKTAGATEKLAAVEFRAQVLEQAARHGQLAHPEFLLFQAEQAKKAADGGKFDVAAWIDANKSGLLAPAFAAPTNPAPANSGRPAGGPPDATGDLDTEIARAEKEGRTLDAIALKRKKAGFIS